MRGAALFSQLFGGLKPPRASEFAGMSELAPTTCAFRAHSLWVCARKDGLECSREGRALSSGCYRDLSPQDCIRNHLNAFPADREVRSQSEVPRE